MMETWWILLQTCKRYNAQIGVNWSIPPLLISGFNLTTCDLYFTILVQVFTNHILSDLSENIYFRNHIERTIHDYGLQTFK